MNGAAPPTARERPGDNRGEPKGQANNQTDTDSSVERGYPLDDRGLYATDSGFVFAVRATQRPGEHRYLRIRRRWFKSRAQARRLAVWYAEHGRRATVERYEISNRRVLEVIEPETPHTRFGGTRG